MIELGILIVLLVLVWYGRKTIRTVAVHTERSAKVFVAEAGIDTAKRAIAVSKQIDELKDIPNIDDLLNRLNGTSSTSK